MSGAVPLEVRRLAPQEVRARLSEIAALRIAVFRAWPYLYDGDLAYEHRYLDTYVQAPGAVVIGAFAGDGLVGAATATPLAQHEESFSAPLARSGLDVSSIFYFGESVLMPEHRGKGVGVAFFEQREHAARISGHAICLFSAVVRPADHPLRSADHVPLDGFWRKRGYRPIDGLTTRYAWRDVGDEAETAKPMAFWMKRLAQSPDR